LSKEFKVVGAEKKESKSSFINLKLSDYIGKKLKDISNETSNELVLYFDNGYNIRVTGNIFIVKEEQ